MKGIRKTGKRGTDQSYISMKELMRLNSIWDIGAKESVNKNQNWIFELEKREAKVIEKELFY